MQFKYMIVLLMVFALPFVGNAKVEMVKLPVSFVEQDNTIVEVNAIVRDSPTPDGKRVGLLLAELPFILTCHRTTQTGSVFVVATHI